MFKKLFLSHFFSNLSKLWIVIFCLILCSTGFIVIDSFIKNVGRVVSNETKPLLGGDIVLRGGTGMNSEQLKVLGEIQNRYNMKYAEVIETSSVVNIGNKSKTFNTRFYSQNYPFYGNMDFTLVTGTSLTGGLLIDEESYDSFLTGMTIPIFGYDFPVYGILKNDAQTDLSLFQRGGKAYIPIELIGKTNLLGYGNKLDYEYFIKTGNEDDISVIKKEISENKVFSNFRVSDYKSSQQQISDILSQFDRFLKIFLIVAFMIASISIYLSVESYFFTEKKKISILRILGLTNMRIVLLYFSLFFIIFTVSYVFSVILSYVIYQFIPLYSFTKDFYLDNISVFIGLIISFIVLFVSVVIPFAEFIVTNPLTGLKEGLSIRGSRKIYIQSLFLFLGIFFIYYLNFKDLSESFIFTGVALVGLLAVSLIIKLLLFILFGLGKFYRKNYFLLYDSIRSTIKPGNISIPIIISFFVSMSGILTVSIFAFHFLDKLNFQADEKQPNMYVLNIMKKDIPYLQEHFPQDPVYEIVQARIVSINGLSLSGHLHEDHIPSEFSREFFTTTNNLESLVIEGKASISSGEVSVDQSFANRLKVKIGDNVKFSITGREFDLKIVNIRKPQRVGTSPFFFFSLNSEQFKEAPKNYFIATNIQPQNIEKFQSDLTDNLGNHFSFINVTEILGKIQTIAYKIISVVESFLLYLFVFCLILLCSVLTYVFYFKKLKNSIYHTLGASSLFIRNSTFIEYLYIISIAFILSLVTGFIAGNLLIYYSRFLEINMIFNLYALGVIFTVFIINTIILKIITYKFKF